ncbi:MAG TPA: alkaline phosphatase family protein [Anaerolineales bacterium]|nr:alkaline phosphatase family protein [Anaerolineales bacterium]
MKTLILGFDSFDPAVFEEMAGQNQLPNLEKFAQQGGYSKLEVCSPPQTEVSWTSIATGMDPGGHGIFDFVHRDPASYTPYVSILPMRKSATGEQFVPPYTAKTFFEEAADMGYPATALWWPAMFPARPAVPVNTLPGLGTPDIRGQLGVGTLLTTEEEVLKKTAVVKWSSDGRKRFSAALSGPQTQGRGGPRTIHLPISLEVIDATSARLTVDQSQFDLRLGEWSDIVELRFKAGFLLTVHAITRFILTSLDGRIRVYALPLQIHPLHSPWHYASSTSFSKKLWKEVGPYLTLGWPQDTTGLEEGCISDDQFLDLCQSIFDRRIQILYCLMNEFREGVLAAIFDDLDRVQHMFFQNRMDVVQDWYRRLDLFVGDVSAQVNAWTGKYRYLIMSDHGFSTFEKKVHLNRWLLENGFLSMKNGNKDLDGVDWNKTRAYAVGLNSIYLNIAGREGQGIVSADEVEPLLGEIKRNLLNWQDDGQGRVIHKVRLKHETYSGPYTRFGPDVVVGYASGYRASAETGLGKIPSTSLEPNTDHWGADHCMDAEVVPGVIFANRDLRDFGGISFRDIPFLAIGKHPEPYRVLFRPKLGSRARSPPGDPGRSAYRVPNTSRA